MSTMKAIPGVERTLDFDCEANEPTKAERVAKEVRQGRAVEINDPLIDAAITAVQELADSMQRKIDVQWDRATGTIVVTVSTKEGEIIRRFPPNEAIRMAQNVRNWRAQYLDGVF